jgi:hypothetical protein
MRFKKNSTEEISLFLCDHKFIFLVIIIASLVTKGMGIIVSDLGCNEKFLLLNKS